MLAGIGNGRSRLCAVTATNGAGKKLVLRVERGLRTAAVVAATHAKRRNGFTTRNRSRWGNEGRANGVHAYTGKTQVSRSSTAAGAKLARKREGTQARRRGTHSLEPRYNRARNARLAPHPPLQTVTFPSVPCGCRQNRPDTQPAVRQARTPNAGPVQKRDVRQPRISDPRGPGSEWTGRPAPTPEA